VKAGVLLDVNVLIAMAWPTHRAHEKAQEWARAPRARRVGNMPTDPDRLRPYTLESGFLSKRTHSRDALALLQANLGHPAHQFWPDEVGLAHALEPFAQGLTGHQQVTDAYLLGLAMHKKGKLATMDRAVRGLLPDKSPEGRFPECDMRTIQGFSSPG